MQKQREVRGSFSMKDSTGSGTALEYGVMREPIVPKLESLRMMSIEPWRGTASQKCVLPEYLLSQGLKICP